MPSKPLPTSKPGKGGREGGAVSVEGGREGGREGMLTFGGRKGHTGLSEFGLELVEDGGAKSGGDVAGDALHHA